MVDLVNQKINVSDDHDASEGVGGDRMVKDLFCSGCPKGLA